MAECSCFSPQLDSGDYDSRDVGETYETNGRSCEASVLTCRQCGSKWLYYRVDYWAYKHSARWYRGLIPETAEHPVVVESAVKILETSECRFEGGPHFDSTGRNGTGRIDVDL